ncbi:MAG: NADH-quinone oxidoreductase subunit NuoE, partial [Pseudomonadota bacterium]
MAVRRLAEEQPQSFEFTPANLSWARAKIADYPEGRQASAVIPILWRAQEQHHGWLPEPAIRVVAEMLDMPYIRVFEIATFYTMFQLKPVGTVAHVGVCGTTPCMLRGSEDLISVCKERIAARPFMLSKDGRFSWEEVECAGACVNAPMVQIGPDTYEDLTEQTFRELLDALDAGLPVQTGPQSARRASEPVSGASTLKTPAPSHPDTGHAPAEARGKVSEDPSTTKARAEHAAKPSGIGRAEAEAARSRPPASEAGAAPQPSSSDDDKADAASLSRDEAATERADSAGTRPQALTRESAGTIDELQRISGIGKVIE